MKLDLRNKLSVENWEKALHNSPLSARKGWSRDVRSEGLIINLSKVGWVEPVAALRMVLFIEAALVEGVNVTINLPYPVATKAEQKHLDLPNSSKDEALRKKKHNIANNLSRRVAAAVALRNLRFKESLQHPHIEQAPGQLTIIDYHDWSVSQNESNIGTIPANLASILSPEEPLAWTFDVVYGLQWIPDPRSPEGRKIIDHLAELDILADILTHPSQRVSTADGATLAHVFLKELVENAIDHSGRSFALIAAMRRKKGYNLKEEEIYECEKGFAKWCTDYPLIEIMVGDSGSGIPSSLVKEYKEKNPPTPEKLIGSSTNTRILAWSFDKWSSKSAATSKRGTRGLYRAERIVRKYDGCITLRSESSYVGIECGFNNPPDYIYQQSLPKIPGTVVHVRLPVISSENLPPRATNPALHRANMEVVDFHDLNWTEPKRTIDFISERVRRRSAGKSATRGAVCLVLDFAYVKLERRTLEDLLLRLVLIAHPVALVVTNVQAPSADSAQQTIHSIAEQLAPQERSRHSAEAPDATEVRDAILFQNTDGTFTWVGAAPNIAVYLDRLWSQEKITLAELIEEIPDEAKRNELIRQFREAYHIVHRVEKSANLALNFNEQDIIDALQNHITQLVLSKIDKGSSASLRVGTFRTPSLEVVSRYVKVRDLLTEIGLQRTTAVLARKCVNVSGLKTAKRFQIIADSTASREVLESFGSNLSSILQLPQSSSIISQVNQGQIPDVADDNEIILFTDVILAGDLLAGLISQILRGRRSPVLIATGLDARAEEKRGKPMTVMGRRIDVVSIVEIAIWVKNSAKVPEIINISPITHEPEVAGGEPTSDYPVTHERLTRMIEEQNALYFDHIVRPNGRHLCFYLDPFRLLGALDTADPYDLSEDGRVLIKEFEQAIDAWLLPGQKLDVIYYPNLPRTERPSATKKLIGEKLAERYDAQLRGVSSLSEITFPEPNPPPGGRTFQYHPSSTDVRQHRLFGSDTSDSPSLDPDSTEEIGSKTVTIIDWGSVTGTGIRASIRYAAARGASRILAVALVSQLPFDEERFLASLTGVETALNKENTPIVLRSEVKVVFLSRYPTQVYEPRLCPYCRQLERLSEEQRFQPSKLLDDFIKQVKKLLRPRHIEGKDGVRKKYEQRRLMSQKTAPGVADNYQVTTIAALRNQIDMARRWTGERLKLHQDLATLEAPLDKESYSLRMNRRCLIKLLAVEWLWLKGEPLSMIKFKRQIAKLAVNVIKDRYCSTMEKLEAVVVLRTASKDSFAQYLPEIFEAFIQDRTATEKETKFLVSQLLYCSFTYLQRDYLLAPTLEPLVHALGQIASRVYGLLGGPNQTIALRVGRTVNSLYQYGRFLSRSANPETPPVAWRELRTVLIEKYHTHHPVYVAFDALRFGYLEKDIEDPTKQLPKLNWVTKRRGWDNKCEPFITTRVLPLLTPLREVFEGLDANVMVDPHLAEMLAVGAREIIDNLSAIKDALAIFSKNPKAARQIDRWRRFVNARNFIWDLLMDPGVGHRDNRKGGSALIRLLQDCPSNIVTLVQEELEESLLHDVLRVRLTTYVQSGASSLVFCHGDILRDGVRELLLNASRHVSAEVETTKEVELRGGSIPRKRRIVLDLELTEEGDFICLTARNGGTLIESEVHGRGLEMFMERLRPYGASLERINNLRSPWVFGVKVSLMKG